MFAAVFLAAVFGWVLQRGWFSNPRFDSTSERIRNWIERDVGEAFLLSILQGQLALLALVLVFVVDALYTGWIRIVLAMLCALASVAMFAMKGFIWSWFYTQCERKIKDGWPWR